MLTINITKKSLILIFIGMIVIITGVAGTFYYLSYIKDEKQELSTPLTQEEIEALVVEVSKIMILPDSKNPIVITVANPKPLKKQNQSFFEHAKAGDKILIFLETNQAILYSQKKHQILSIAQLDPETAAALAFKYGPPDNLSNKLQSAPPLTSF